MKTTQYIDAVRGVLQLFKNVEDTMLKVDSINQRRQALTNAVQSMLLVALDAIAAKQPSEYCVE